MAAIPFVPRIDDAPYATSQQLSPLVRRVIAENPSKFTELARTSSARTMLSSLIQAHASIVTATLYSGHSKVSMWLASS